MKKIIALVLSLALLLGCASALAETEKTYTGEFNVDDQFTIKWVAPEGYVVEDVRSGNPGTMIARLVPAEGNEDKPIMLMSIAFDEQYAEVGRLNDLDAETLAEIEATFKECVKDAYTKADNSLKGTISGFENELKKQCEWALREYFAELIEAENIDFLNFEKAMELGKIKISMAEAKRSTPRQAQDALAAVVSNIAVGMEQISQMDDAPAIMAEFKQCFDVGRSVATVQARRKREQEEAEAAEARKRAQEAQAAAVAKVQAAAPAKAVAAPEMSETVQSSPTLQPVPFTVPAEDPVFPEFTFTVYGARKSQLVQIRDFLKQEGIRYE